MRIIHAGLPKTGTTHLQTGLFRLINSEYDLPEMHLLARRIVRELRFPKEANDISDLILDLPDQFLMSAETFTGFDPKYWQKNLQELVNATDDDTYFIVCVRRPSQWLKSCFLQLSKSNYNGNFDDLFSTEDLELTNYQQHFTINTDIYISFLNYLKQNPRIFYYEYTNDANESFIKVLSKIYPNTKVEFTDNISLRSNKPFGEFLHRIRKIKNVVGGFFSLVSKDMYIQSQKNWQKTGDDYLWSKEEHRPINRKISRSGKFILSIDKLLYMPVTIKISEKWLKEMKKLDEIYEKFFAQQ